MIVSGDGRPGTEGPACREHGSVTVVAAAVLLVTGVLCLAGVDVMRTLHAKARAQTAADAAALAAAQEIALPSGEAPESAAQVFAARNGASLVSCACRPGSPEAVVEVEVPVDLVFVGADRLIRARARAVVEGISGG